MAAQLGPAQQIKARAAHGCVLHNPEMGDDFSSEKAQTVTVNARILRLVDDGDLFVV